MRQNIIRLAGVVISAGYATLIVILYVNPQSGDVLCRLGVRQIDRQAVEDGDALFGVGEFATARIEFESADPARCDPTTQFYIAYTHYCEGWSRWNHDDEQFQRGLEAVNRAIERAPEGRLEVDGPDIRLQTAAELKKELEDGLKFDLGDLNPLRRNPCR